jgi:hypothetical protein
VLHALLRQSLPELAREGDRILNEEMLAEPSASAAADEGFVRREALFRQVLREVGKAREYLDWLVLGSSSSSGGGFRVSRLVARTGTDSLARHVAFPLQRYLFWNDLLEYPAAYHPVALCVCVGVMRAVSPYLASFQGSRFGRVVTRSYFRSSRNRWLPTQRIAELNLNSDDCKEMDEVDQGADLCLIARDVARALGTVQTDARRQYEALTREGFRQVGAGGGG